LTLLALALARPSARAPARMGVRAPARAHAPTSAPGGVRPDAVKHAAASASGPEARQLYGAAAMLAASVLSDSALEHYRGQFDNPGMFTPLVSSAMVLGSALQALRAPSHSRRPLRAGLPFAAACAVGLAGLGFHAYNVMRRPGGLSWGNLFYAAPLGAPAALSLAGAVGLAAREVEAGAPTLLSRPSGQALSLLAGFGLAGTTVEAGLLHFRGAFQHPAMWLPVTLPPVGAALLLGAALKAPPSTGAATGPGRLARAWLKGLSWLGLAGMGFHARGVARQMGGWRNWSQNLFSGPPLPAPPSFSALALAGQAALALRARDRIPRLPVQARIEEPA
jgi:hypothetical protein